MSNQESVRAGGATSERTALTLEKQTLAHDTKCRRSATNRRKYRRRPPASTDRSPSVDFAQRCGVDEIRSTDQQKERNDIEPAEQREGFTDADGHVIQQRLRQGRTGLQKTKLESSTCYRHERFAVRKLNLAAVGSVATEAEAELKVLEQRQHGAVRVDFGATQKRQTCQHDA